MEVLTFFASMHLSDLVAVNDRIRKRRYEADATKREDCGSIKIYNYTPCGLFDPWHGGGSALALKPEKDVILPIKFIQSAMPDGKDGLGYSVRSIYGYDDTFWFKGNAMVLD